MVLATDGAGAGGAATGAVTWVAELAASAWTAASSFVRHRLTASASPSIGAGYRGRTSRTRSPGTAARSRLMDRITATAVASRSPGRVTTTVPGVAAIVGATAVATPAAGSVYGRGACTQSQIALTAIAPTTVTAI